MKRIVRKNACNGIWGLFLLPLCVFLAGFHSNISLHIFLSFMLLWCSFTDFMKENLCGVVPNKICSYITEVILSILLWNSFSFSFHFSLIISFIAVSYYNYLLSSLLIKCRGSFTIGEAHIVSQSILLFLLNFICSFLNEDGVMKVVDFQQLPKSIKCLQVLVFGCLILVHSMILFPTFRRGFAFVLFSIILSVIMLFIWKIVLENNVFAWIWLFCIQKENRTARLLQLPYVGDIIENAFQIFLDEKDSGLLILTHIYLLFGTCFPIWIFPTKKGYHICLLSGILSIGFGDTAAAVGGKYFGRHFWQGSKRTYEGSACGLISQIIPGLIFLLLGHSPTAWNIFIVILASICTTLLEAKTTQVDNLVLPLFMFLFLSWIQ